MDRVTRRKFIGTASVAAASVAVGSWVFRTHA